jgi:hypothetical protein
VVAVGQRARGTRSDRGRGRRVGDLRFVRAQLVAKDHGQQSQHRHKLW